MATLAMSTGIQGRRSGERSSSTHAAHRCAGAAVTLSVGHRGATRIQACRERGVAEGDSMMNRTPGTVTASCDGVEVGIRERKVPMEGRRTALMASAATTMGVCAAALPLWLPREAAAGIPDVGEVLPSSDKVRIPYVRPLVKISFSGSGRRWHEPVKFSADRSMLWLLTARCTHQPSHVWIIL